MTTTVRPFIPRSVPASFPIRMIALDIDGTLVDDDLILPDRTIAAIRRASRRGIHVSLVTGRMTSSAIRFAETLGLSTPVIGYQGALIREMPEDPYRVGRMLRHRPLAPGVARTAEAWSRERGLDPHVNHLERLVIRGDDPRVDDYSAFLGTRATRVRDLGEWITRPVTKIVAVGPAGLPMSLLAEARRAFAGRADVTVAHPRFLEFVAPGVSKGEAVRWLARRHGHDLSQALAIGDQLNDLEMLAAVGHGTSMPSAPPAVIAAARYVAPSLSDEGAAEIIERLALTGSRDAAAASAELADRATELRATLPTGDEPSRSEREPASANERVRVSGPALSDRPPILPDDDVGRSVALDVLNAGGVVALPTDTVYGIAVRLGAPDSIERLFHVKRRPPEKGIALLLGSAEQANAVGQPNAMSRRLAAAFWPGPLTLVLPRNPEARLPAVLTDGVPTVGVRLPDHPTPRALAAVLGPLPTTSANRSGEPDSLDVDMVVQQLGNRVDLILDGGRTPGAAPSTVVDCTGATPRILREGVLGTARILEALRLPEEGLSLERDPS